MTAQLCSLFQACNELDGTCFTTESPPPWCCEVVRAVWRGKLARRRNSSYQPQHWWPGGWEVGTVSQPEEMLPNIARGRDGGKAFRSHISVLWGKAHEQHWVCFQLTVNSWQSRIGGLSVGCQWLLKMFFSIRYNNFIISLQLFSGQNISIVV